MEPEMYASYRKSRWTEYITRLMERNVKMAIEAGMEWDPVARAWKPVDYIGMTPEQLQARRDAASDRVAEVKAQVKGLLPEAAGQALLNKGAEELLEVLIKLAKKAPVALLESI